jgi:hypothetical protein
VDAIGPDVDVLLSHQRALAPGFVLFPPHTQQKGDGCGRKVGCFRTRFRSRLFGCTPKHMAWAKFSGLRPPVGKHQPG